MIGYSRTILKNGLKVIIHEDDSTPMAVVNLLYDVGSSDEDPLRTGSAHLLEHLMFGGSVNIPSYDTEVRKAGGENNAFTSNDITNYYIQLPAANLETGLWLESDRMLDLRFSQKGFDIQKNVVIEEFKQRYLNQPYGDMWMLLRPLAYTIHPYKWPTIGSDISHIENITLEEIKQFFYEHYCPSNAILCITGKVSAENCFRLAEKWFGHIGKRKKKSRELPEEPRQGQPRKMDVSRDVPSHEIILAYNMCGRKSPQYYTHDLISDLLAGGKSSRFYRQLVMKKKLFSSINAYITGDRDPGLFIIKGRPANCIDIEVAHKALLDEIRHFTDVPPGEEELNKVRNKLEATRLYTHSDILHKAMDLAYHELMGDAGNINSEMDKYREISRTGIRKTAGALFAPENSSTLYYCSNHKSTSIDTT
jgi:zinc protease